MPPKLQISREMIIETGLDIIRTHGADALNVRKIAAELGCSTQPVMYQFSTVNELRDTLYQQADKLHSEYLMNMTQCENPMMAVGMNYIKFAFEEKHLFRFLFQSDNFNDNSLSALISNEGLTPVYSILHDETGLNEQQCKDAFSALFLTVHGIASLLANNSMEYDEEHFENVLNNVFMGIIGIMKGGE